MIAAAEPRDSKVQHPHLGPWVSEWFAAQFLQRRRGYICVDGHLCGDKTRWIHQLVNGRMKRGNTTSFAWMPSMEVMNIVTYWQANMMRWSASLCSSKTSDSKAVTIHCSKRGAEDDCMTCCLQVLASRFLSTRSDSYHESIAIVALGIYTVVKASAIA